MKIEKKRRVVITGLGTVNPTGNTVAESWAAVKAGRCAVGPITAFDTTDFKVKLAAEVKDFDPAERIDRREARKMARFTQWPPLTKPSTTAALHWKISTTHGSA
jgi:3-oxoacyl-[acyl-carrier-protein] synthase II